MKQTWIRQVSAFEAGLRKLSTSGHLMTTAPTITPPGAISWEKAPVSLRSCGRAAAGVDYGGGYRAD